MDFLETPEKLKALRRQLGMRQYQLAGTDVSSAFISMIELGKRGLTRSTAEKIVEMLNEKAKNIGIKLNIDADYLLCTAQEEAAMYCTKQLELCPNIEQAKALTLVCQKYKIDGVESKIHRYIADILFDENESYGEAAVEYSYAIDLCKNMDDSKVQPYLYNRHGRCNLCLLRHKEALFLFERATHYARIYNDLLTEQRSLYNAALCHAHLGNYDAALETLTHFFHIIDKDTERDLYIRALILKGNCYKEKNNFLKALEIYNSILLDFDKLSPSLEGLIYTNIGGSHLEKSNYAESLVAFTKAQQIRDEHDKFGLSFTLVEKSKVFKRQGLTNEAISVLDLALQLAEQYGNLQCLLEGYLLLEEIYKKGDEVERLKLIYRKLADLLKDSGKDQDFMRVTTALALLHLNDSEVVAAKECLKMAQKSTMVKFNNII